MAGKVFFTDFHAKFGDGILNKFDRLIKTSEIDEIDLFGDESDSVENA